MMSKALEDALVEMEEEVLRIQDVSRQCGGRVDYDFCAACGFFRPTVEEEDGTRTCGDCYQERVA
jgi:hypothetical protein